MQLTLGFMQVGHDQQTSANCKSRLWFGAGQATFNFSSQIQLSFSAMSHP